MSDLIHPSGAVVHMTGERLSLTDMWRAAGCPENREPFNWSRFEGARFIEVIAQLHNLSEAQVLEAKKGRNGGTWAHWQIGIAYAQYLSPEFHAWCNSVVRERMEGRQPVEAAQVAKASAPRISGALLREVMSFPDKLRAAFPSLSETAMQAAFSKLSGQVLGEPLIPMPTLEAHFYTASEIAAEHGVSVNRVGRVSNEAGIPRDDSTGQMRLGKSEHSAKQVEQWFWSPAGKALVDDAIRAWKATQPSA